MRVDTIMINYKSREGNRDVRRAREMIVLRAVIVRCVGARRVRVRVRDREGRALVPTMR